MSGIVNSIGDTLGFGETDAQQEAKDSSQFARELARSQQIKFPDAQKFAGSTLEADPFKSGSLSVDGNSFTGLDVFNQQNRDSLSTFRNTLSGNQSALIRARTNPLKDALAKRRSELRSNLSRRGVQGSFAEKDLTNLDISGANIIGDVQAQTINESAKTLFGAEQNVFNTEFARAMEGLGLTIKTQTALKVLAANLFTGAGSTAASALGAGSRFASTFADVEANQQKVLLDSFAGAADAAAAIALA